MVGLNLVRKALAIVSDWVKGRSIRNRTAYEGKVRLNVESRTSETGVGQRPHRGYYLRRST
jgi:CRISPR/Cas system CMR subunit Cmr4 (Cas7 group RAMP superfamily)